MSDQQMTCSDCGGSFVFSESEAQFYETKRLTPPKRCKTCRLARKAADGGRGAARPTQSREGNQDRGPGAGPPRNFRDRGRPQGRPGGPGAGAPAPAWGRMGGDAPRAPRFSGPSHGHAGSAPRGRFGDNRPQAPRAPREAVHADKPAPEAAAARPPKAKKPRPAFDVTCIQCGTAAQVPFKPIEGRDVFCQPCYRARRGTSGPVTEPNLEATPATPAEPSDPGPSA
jgi:CxxC-x17-CxxC domain-containing protein